ncbi:Phosphoglycerate mutase [Madurella fahalii]|uniref:Phosphoglycerate mutase n=1 Tax=Madurella fahalii TaxID=1157608 RepID=A0ABQ0GN86_9PEZI
MAPPAFLFVVRHGYRLDAADKQWHLSSPAPYDPPLTYSGWQQAKSLGVRIASILRERIHEDEKAASQVDDPTAQRKHKRYKVVLHSSPFLRCVQTAIAISAGLAQDSTPLAPRSCLAKSPSPASTQDARPRPTINTDVRSTNGSDAGPDSQVKIRRSVLRLDGFLGEWLSPGYFELITPPPGSLMMIASAKADLLRREDYSHYPTFSTHNHSNSRSQLWSPVTRSSPGPPPTGSQSDSLESMDSLTSTLPRSASVSSHSSHNQRPSTPRRESPGYVSPVPHYAVSNNNTIPPGYVSHARDACVDIDYQWDSTRGPLDWGDGGTFPEEWPDMHKRFRAGVQRLVDWYSTAENPTEMITAVPRKFRKESADSFLDDAEDVETEAVVILVSHGAGCNALIGAITHQPVLMDVGMASLTMAVRKPNIPSRDNYNSNSSGSSGANPPIHELYDLKLFANTEHLRSPAQTPTPTRPPSIASAFNGPRGRHLSFSGPTHDSSWNDGSVSRNSSANAALSGLRRGSNNASPRAASLLSGITVGSGVTSFSPARPRILTPGLWSPISSREEEEEGDVLLPNFANVEPEVPKVTAENSRSSASNSTVEIFTETITAVSVESPTKREPSQLGVGHGGLWGGGPCPPDEADRMRDLSSTKRRWTVTERSQ